ncbi:MAG TPA: threonyl-tRNA synthetase editing domain-containing protein [Marinilabiliaceae bacterium]|nr:threonyl-tRNA synthetase editing domain-containing protein [Marinilabiliaceae bacterium]
MKVLSFYTTNFSFTLGEPNIDEPIAENKKDLFSECIVAFIHVEEADEELTLISREKKLTNHLKWVARKNKTKKIVLHSFAHLAMTKASLKFTKELLDACEERLKNGNYETAQTPFGYFLNLNMEAPGFSMARIWAEL